MSGTCYRVIETNAGPIGFAATRLGLQRVFLPHESAARLRAEIAAALPGASEDDTLLPDLARSLATYFRGESVRFKVRFDWARHPEFQIDVWRACAAIPYGETRSYGDLARDVGRPGAARAVGMAMGRNPCPIVVPCHRVVRSDGSIGGYSGREGVAFKRQLLELEGAAGTGVV